MNCYSRRKIASNLLLAGGRFTENPLIEIDSTTGEILSIEQLSINSGDIDRSAHTEFYSGILMAGFVNAHCHLELSHLRGTIAEGCGLQSFVRSVGELRSKVENDYALREMACADNEMFRSGIVAVGDIVNNDLGFDIKERSAIEYHNFIETFGLGRENLDDVKTLLKYKNTSLTPHSTYSLNDNFFREIAEQETKRPLSIHFMESTNEALLFEKRGTLYEWFEKMRFSCDFLHHLSPAERIINCVPKNRSIMLVHNCATTQEDIELIMEHFLAPVYWVICPQSNHFISRNCPPTELLRRMGLNICIGTDSLASNHSLSPLDELRALSGIPLEERLDWATRQGAWALGLDHLGDIEVGKRPGLLSLSGIDYAAKELLPQSKITRII